MSDFPELGLLDEVQDLATSSDFFAFTRDQFNQAWEDESSSWDSGNSTTGLWQTPERSQQPEWRDLYERSLWDPMLCDGLRTADTELFDASQRQDESIFSGGEGEVTCEEIADDFSSEVIMEAAPAPFDEPKMWNSFVHIKTENGNATPAFPQSTIVDTCQEGSNRLSLTKSIHRSSGAVVSVRPASPRSLKSRFFPLLKQQMKKRRSRASSNTSGHKRKLYEMPQFLDENKERCRQNAINSKINRDRKKLLLSEAETTIVALKTMNRRLVREADSSRQRLLAARQEIQLLKKQLALDD
jgi:hypothetical protein